MDSRDGGQFPRIISPGAHRMKMIEFVLKNKDVIQKLFSEESDGEFFLPAEEFCFDNAEMKVQWDEMSLKFTIEVAPFKFVTALMPDELKEYLDELKSITCPDIRRTVVELLEGEIKEAVDQEKDMAKDNMEEAKATLDEATKSLDGVLDAISSVKHEWGIP